MESVNLRDPSQIANRIYVGHLNDSITSELLDVKFSPYGKIVGILRTTPTFAFIQFEQASSAQLAIESENGSFLANQRIMVKAAEMKSHQKRPQQNQNDGNMQQQQQQQPMDDEQPMNKKYFSEANEYYGNNSIMGTATNDSEVNHCEIIVVSKAILEYAEQIEGRLRMLGMHADLLFPREDVAINKVLGNIQSRGALYGILLTPMNKDKRSLTLTILYGDAMEHRNMPLEDAIKFIYKDFVNKTKGLSTNRSYQHPDAIQTLLKTLYENRSLTVLQYDHIIKYLQDRRAIQVKAEIGEDVSSYNNNEIVSSTTTTSTTSAVSSNPVYTSASSIINERPFQSDLQKKILDILNKKDFTEKIAQQMEQKTKLSKSDKDELRQKVMKDERVKTAMNALLQKRNNHV